MRTFENKKNLILAALLAGATLPAWSATFTPGNLVVEQVGNGAAALSSSAAQISLAEYSPSGTAVQSIALPTNGVSALVDAGNSGTEGMASLAADGQFLILAGYNTNYGVASIASTTAAAAPRAVGYVNASGAFTLGPVSLTNFNTYNIRAAASDGNGNFWALGSGGSAVATEGVCYMGNGTPAPLYGTVYNSRVVKDIGGNLYYATGSGSRGILEITGQPTAGTVATNYVIPTGAQFGTISSPYGFVFNPAMTVAYVADSDTYTNSTTLGGVEKWTNNAGTWVFAYTLAYGNNGASGLAVDFSQANPVIYGTTYNGNSLFSIVDTGASSTGTLLATAAANTAFRSVSFAPTNAPSVPTITGIMPASTNVALGGSVTFSANVYGAAPISYFWYFETATATNKVAVAGAPSQYLTLTNITAANVGNYQLVVSNASLVSVTSSVVSLTVTVTPPAITNLTPASATAIAGGTAAITVAATGSAPLSYFWYFESATATNLIAGATSATLSLSNLLAPNAGNYQVVVSNASALNATSALVNLTVLDPAISVEPASAQGVVGGVVQFAVTAVGTAPLSYQWYLTDASGDILAPATSLGDGSVLSGANTGVLTFSNLQPADLNNFVVVVSNVYGAVTSTVASTLPGNGTAIPYTGGVLALWDFDGSQFTNTAVNPNCMNDPAPLIGNGTAWAVGSCYDPGTSPFSGATDPGDVGLDVVSGGYVFTPYGFDQPSPNFSWGTENYPYPATAGTNKANGVQFNVSTVGARNIQVAYDSRCTTTASLYERLQYTTNGATWNDYPASSTFDGLSQTTGSGGFYTFNYDLSGFPGVDNNPNFGFRVVTEWISTATYGVNSSNIFVGNANTYGSAGTLTYDIVAITGDAITNSYTPPVLGGFVNTNMVVTNTLAVNFTASDAEMAASELTFNVQSLNTVTAGRYNQTVQPNYNVVSTGPTNFQLQISFPPGGGIPDPVDATPVLVTATDTNGETANAWFNLMVTSINPPPTNTLTAVPMTNLLANTSLTIPFYAGSANSAYSNLTFTAASANNTVVPAANIVVTGNTNTGNMLVTVTPAANMVGNAVINVSVNDNYLAEPRTATATIALQVQPNTNVVAIDEFNYDAGLNSSVGLDDNSGGYWQHLSGVLHQMTYQNGAVTVDTADNTENVQAQLLGGSYGTNDLFTTNSGLTLYASFWVSMSPTEMPIADGTYFLLFNNGSGSTGPYEGRVMAATNGAAPGYYRLGINNFDANATDGAMFPLDLAPGNNYFVVMSLVLSNGYSTIWVSPTNKASLSVMDTGKNDGTNLYNIADIELRESGSDAGSVMVSSLMVGLSFDSVFYPVQANPVTYGMAENTTMALTPLTVDDGWGLKIQSAGAGTITSNSTALLFTPTTNFIGSTNLQFTVGDNLGNTSSSTITVTVTNAPVAPTPIPLNASSLNNPDNNAYFVLSWTNSAFNLQFSTNVAGPYVTVPGATSPYTNMTGTNAAGFFRLVH